MWKRQVPRLSRPAGFLWTEANLRSAAQTLLTPYEEAYQMPSSDTVRLVQCTTLQMSMWALWGQTDIQPFHFSARESDTQRLALAPTLTSCIHTAYIGEATTMRTREISVEKKA